MRDILNKKLLEVLEKIEYTNLELAFMEELIKEYPLLENQMNKAFDTESNILKELIVHKCVLLKLINRDNA